MSRPREAVLIVVAVVNYIAVISTDREVCLYFILNEVDEAYLCGSNAVLLTALKVFTRVVMISVRNCDVDDVEVSHDQGG